MSSTNGLLEALPPDLRREAEEMLSQFDDGWHPERLIEMVAAVPDEKAIDRRILLIFIQRDLERQWAAGNEPAVEDYLTSYPELGSIDEVPLELIATEYELRRQRDRGDLAEFAERYPTRIDDLYVMLKPDLFEADTEPSPPQTVPVDPSRRLMLLLAEPPAEVSTDAPIAPIAANQSDPISMRRLHLLARLSEADIEIEPPSQPVDDGEFDYGATPETSGLNLPSEILRYGAPSSAAVLVPKAEQTTNNLPRQFGPYRVVKRLGGSRNAPIYEALDTRTQKPVLVRVPALPSGDHAKARAQLHLEAKAASGLNHPNLCPVLDSGQQDVFDYLITPVVEGQSLEAMFGLRPIWTPVKACEVAMAVATAMETAHQVGVIHRGLKPTNIVVSEERPIVTGFALPFQPADPGDADAAYAAPELTGANPVPPGPRSDVFALGVILYRLLTGRVPEWNATGQPVSPTRIVPTVPAELEAVCLKALARTPDARFGTMRAFGLALATVHGQLVPPLPKVETAGAITLDTPKSETFVQISELRRMSSVLPKPKPPGSSLPKNLVMPSRRKIGRMWLLFIGVASVLATVLGLLVVKGWGPWRTVDDPELARTEPAPPEPPRPAPLSPERELQQRLAELSSPDPTVRKAAVEKLAKIRKPQVIEALNQRVADDLWADGDPDTGGKAAALVALTDLAPATVTDALIAAVRSANPKVRIWAIGEMVPRADDACIDSLVYVLKDRSPRVRKAAAEALGKIEARDAIPALEARVADDLWEPKSTAPIADGPIHDPDFGGKGAALKALKDLADDKVVDRALRRATESASPAVRTWALRELSRDMK